jgi:topoisomerase-4 subunit A
MEPVTLPAKIPPPLMQGADGIAVGMSTHILPHNFSELLEAEISYLEGKDFRIYPDFPTGGIMDRSQYDKGKGKIKIRAKIEIKDAKTLVIREICYGTTTETLIRSIEEAAKKGKIKIESINDYTSRHVEIEIKLPRGQYAEELIDALYGFTECEVSLTSQIIVIKDGHPWETDVHEILKYNADKLVEFLKRELQIEKERLLEKIFYKTLERLFIENRIYKKIETVKTLEGIHQALETSFKAFIKQLLREPKHEDRERLLQIPIRRISQFDIDKNQEEITLLQENLLEVEKNLKNVKKFTIDYLKRLIDKYGKEYPRKTRVKAIEEIDKRAIETKKIKVGFDPVTGFFGTKVSGPVKLECTNFDKVVLFSKNGTYQVVNIPEKQYAENVAWVGVADKKTVMNVLYRNKETGQPWAKRFIVEQFILEKSYHYIDDLGELLYISDDPKATIEIQFIPQANQKLKKILYPFKTALVKGAQARGIRVANQKVKKVTESDQLLLV